MPLKYIQTKKLFPNTTQKTFAQIFRKTVFEMLNIAKQPKTESGRCHQLQEVSYRMCNHDVSYPQHFLLSISRHRCQMYSIIQYCWTLPTVVTSKAVYCSNDSLSEDDKMQAQGVYVMSTSQKILQKNF